MFRSYGVSSQIQSQLYHLSLDAFFVTVIFLWKPRANIYFHIFLFLTDVDIFDKLHDVEAFLIASRPAVCQPWAREQRHDYHPFSFDFVESKKRVTVLLYPVSAVLSGESH